MINLCMQDCRIILIYISYIVHKIKRIRFTLTLKTIPARRNIVLVRINFPVKFNIHDHPGDFTDMVMKWVIGFANLFPCNNFYDNIFIIIPHPYTFSSKSKSTTHRFIVITAKISDLYSFFLFRKFTTAYWYPFTHSYFLLFYKYHL